MEKSFSRGWEQVLHPSAKQGKPWIRTDMHVLSRESSTARCKGHLQLPPRPGCAMPLSPRGRDQALLGRPSPRLKHRKVTVMSHCRLPAAGCAAQKGRSNQPGDFCSLLSPACELLTAEQSYTVMTTRQLSK